MKNRFATKTKQMPLVKRKPRKLIRLKAAADLLQVSRQTVRNMITDGELTLAPTDARRGATSPLKVYQAEVDQVARQWGIF